MGGRRILTDKQLELMADMRERGKSHAQISRHFTASGTPVSPSCIAWQCIRIGADRPGAPPTDLYATRSTVRGGRPVRAFTSEDDEQLLALDAVGTSYSEIARRLGRKPNSIKGRLYTLARHQARSEAQESA